MFFDYNILNYYVDSYKLQIETKELYKISGICEQKFLSALSRQTNRLIEIIDKYMKIQNKYDEPFINMKNELESSLDKSYLFKNVSNIVKIYENFQKLIKNIEKTLNLTY